MDQYGADKVQHNIHQFVPDKRTMDTSVEFSIILYDTHIHYMQIYLKYHYMILYMILPHQQQYSHQLKQK